MFTFKFMDIMRFAVIYSRKNIAGINIVKSLKENFFIPQIPIIELKDETIYTEDINAKNYPELKNIDFIVFASTHRSKENKPSLCLHAPGNFREANLGGKAGKVAPTSAYVMKFLFQNLKKNKENEVSLNNYELTLEATHHGPDISIPCCFIEVGSTEKEWNDKTACLIIAKTIYGLNDFKANKSYIPAIGIGGPHYCPNFNQIQSNSDYAISHIMPSYSFPITESIIKEAEKKTTEQLKEVVIDWKGCKSAEERENIIKIIDKLGLKYTRTDKIRKTL